MLLRFDGPQYADLADRYLWAPVIDLLLSDEKLTAPNVPGEIHWALADNLGTVRDIARYDPATDTTGVVNHRVYDSFGKLTSETNPAVDLIFGFTGRQFDEATGLQNNTNRWYDPAVGRWLSEDPIGFAADDTNLYRYLGNQSTNATDPSGLWQWPWNPHGARARRLTEDEAAGAIAPDPGVGVVQRPRCMACHGNVGRPWEKWSREDQIAALQATGAPGSAAGLLSGVGRAVWYNAGAPFLQGCAKVANAATNLLVDAHNMVAWLENGVIEAGNIPLEQAHVGYRIPRLQYLPRSDWSWRLFVTDEPRLAHDIAVMGCELILATGRLPRPAGVRTAFVPVEEIEAPARQLRAKPIALKRPTLRPGPFARESIPAPRPGQTITPAMHQRINDIGRQYGCHTCGTMSPGTPLGTFIADHQPPTAMTLPGQSQRLYPQCQRCSVRQGGEVRAWQQ